MSTEYWEARRKREQQKSEAVDRLLKRDWGLRSLYHGEGVHETVKIFDDGRPFETVSIYTVRQEYP